MDPRLRRARRIGQDQGIVPVADATRTSPPERRRRASAGRPGAGRPGREPAAGLLHRPGDQDLVAERQPEQAGRAPRMRINPALPK